MILKVEMLVIKCCNCSFDTNGNTINGCPRCGHRFFYPEYVVKDELVKVPVKVVCDPLQKLRGLANGRGEEVQDLS